MATTPKGIYFPEGSTNADFVSIFSTMASSIDSALGDYTYDSGWIDVLTADMQNSWEPYNNSGFRVKYRKVGKLVSLEGLIRRGTPGTHMFTLPEGFRPSGSVVCGVLVSNTISSTDGNKTTRVNVLASGAVEHSSANVGLTDTSWISLSGINFFVD